MNIKISERALRWFDNVMDLLEKINVQGEIEYHTREYGQPPKKVTIIRYYEDNDKLTPTKNHLILTI